MKNLVAFFRNFSVLLVLFHLTGCSGDFEVIKEYDDADNLIVEYQRRKSDFSKHGWYKVYDANGNLTEESTFQDDALQGVRKLFYEEGMLQIEETYKEGFFEGPYKSYFKNGNLEMEGQYVNNSMEGDWKFYYDDGQLKELVRFKGNEENGPFVEYHANGNLKAKGTYKSGDNEDGELMLFDEAGELERKMNCVLGRCETTWVREEASE